MMITSMIGRTHLSCPTLITITSVRDWSRGWPYLGTVL